MNTLRTPRRSALIGLALCLLCNLTRSVPRAQAADPPATQPDPKGESHQHPTSGQLAFPGAEGYGRFARGGRGGKIYEVTTLDDYLVDKQHPEQTKVIPGSLREAVEAQGPRTIIFRVGGTIQLKDKLVIHNPYCTVAGQTAPGDAICI